MTKMVDAIRYLWWRAWYRIFPARCDLATWLRRNRPAPWHKFKPNCWHNDAGGEWEIHFRDDMAYVERRELKVHAHISDEDGSIVGLTIWDEALRGTDAESSS